MTKLLAIDPSLHHTGYAYRDKDNTIIVGTLDLPRRGRDYHHSLAAINDFFDDLMEEQGFTHVAMEAGIYGGSKKGDKPSKANKFASWGRERLTEVRAIMKRLFSFHDLLILDIYPTTLKKYASGHYKGKKNDIMDVMNKVTGITFNDDNESDAVGLLLIAEGYLNICKVHELEYGVTKFATITKWMTLYMENLGVVFYNVKEWEAKGDG